MLSKEHGELGEHLATEWLRQHGYRICELNWRSGRYELDIVAVRFDTIHFVEVKLRDEESYFAPEQTLTPAKQRSLRRAVAAYLSLHDVDMEPQIDLIAISLDQNGTPTVEYIPEAVISRW
ncbi:MAG: YraN family protein [Rikenellaceae bacterium]|nr:YraN family protein [Rikenellaceae bacterium]